MDKSKKILENKMNRLINLLKEQDPPQSTVQPAQPQQPTQQQPQPQPQTQAQPQQQPQTQQQAQPERKQVEGGNKKIQYLSTLNMFTARTPPNASEWPNEAKDKRQFAPLTDARIVNHLKNYFPTLKATSAKAAKYSDYQFRIILSGNMRAETTIKISTEKDKAFATLEAIKVPVGKGIRDVGNKDLINQLKENKIQIKASLDDIRVWAKTEKPAKEEPGEEGPEDVSGGKERESKYKSGESVSKKEIDNMVSRFFMEELLEIKLEPSDEETKKEAWSKLEPAFRKWFIEEIITQNPKSRVESYIKNPHMRVWIKQQFLEAAKNMSLDQDALKSWAKSLEAETAKTEYEKAKEHPLFKSMVQTASGPTMGYEKRQAREYVVWLIKNFKPKSRMSDKELFSFLTKNMDQYKKSKKRDKTYSIKEESYKVDLSSYIRSLFIEQNNDKQLESGRGGDFLASLNDDIFNKWFRHGGIAAAVDNRVFKGNIFEWFAVEKANFKPKERKVESIDQKEVEMIMTGELLMEAEIWIDARIAEKDGNPQSWTFRVLDGNEKMFGQKTFFTMGKKQVDVEPSQATKQNKGLQRI